MTPDNNSGQTLNSIRPNLIQSLFLFGILLSFNGCGTKPTPDLNEPTAGSSSSATDPASATDPSLKRTSTNVASSTPTIESKPTAPQQSAIPQDSALIQVRKTLSAIEQGDLAEAYEFLPVSFQKDIDDLLVAFARNVDGEVWTRTFEVSLRLIKVMRARKDDFWKLDWFQSNPDVQWIKANWDDGLDVFEELATGPLSQLKSLETATARSLLPTRGSKFTKVIGATQLGLLSDLSRQFSGIRIQEMRQSDTEQ
ncbi:MAG: hypothetical protein FJ267_10745, partial [Planctomycetes bacterium]|nr:hypothetical protein [Planctomycetota bacterium]